jgi:hypothetical protein
MPNRILDLTSGVTMVVSDLHGDKDAFARYVGRFLQLRSRGKVQRLLFTGDMIHHSGPEEDDFSLQMVLDVIRMQNALPPHSVVMLLGNHEMPHIYSTMLARGYFEYTPRFEKAMTREGKREEILTFFDSLPFYVRTSAGVMFTHAGPHGRSIEHLDLLRNFDHQAIINEFDHVLKINQQPDQLRALYGKTFGLPYEMLAKHYIAAESANDPRYDHLLRAYMISQQSEAYEILWDALFTRCEIGMAFPLYQRLLNTFLDAYSIGAPAPQRFLVTGHIPVRGGHAVIAESHLRLASAAHAQPREDGEYLLLDFGAPIASMSELEKRTQSVF